LRAKADKLSRDEAFHNYFETSALLGTNVKCVFDEVVRLNLSKLSKRKSTGRKQSMKPPEEKKKGGTPKGSNGKKCRLQ